VTTRVTVFVTRPWLGVAAAFFTRGVAEVVRPRPDMGLCARRRFAFERGEGCWLVTADGERYLDFAAGIAVNSLGHCHPHLVAALTEQAGKLWHVSNLYQIPGQERLANG
jgi:acetylornithine/succinyldiaminopimelate/putrescine aminotransferase